MMGLFNSHLFASSSSSSSMTSSFSRTSTSASEDSVRPDNDQPAKKKLALDDEATEVDEDSEDDFLEEEVFTFQAPQDYYSNANEVKAAANGMYDALMDKIHDRVQRLEREGKLEKLLQEKTDASKSQNANQGNPSQIATVYK